MERFNLEYIRRSLRIVRLVKRAMSQDSVFYIHRFADFLHKNGLTLDFVYPESANKADEYPSNWERWEREPIYVGVGWNVPDKGGGILVRARFFDWRLVLDERNRLFGRIMRLQESDEPEDDRMEELLSSIKQSIFIIYGVKNARRHKSRVEQQQRREAARVCIQVTGNARRGGTRQPVRGVAERASFVPAGIARSAEKPRIQQEGRIGRNFDRLISRACGNNIGADYSNPSLFHRLDGDYPDLLCGIRDGVRSIVDATNRVDYWRVMFWHKEQSEACGPVHSGILTITEKNDRPNKLIYLMAEKNIYSSVNIVLRPIGVYATFYASCILTAKSARQPPLDVAWLSEMLKGSGYEITHVVRFNHNIYQLVILSNYPVSPPISLEIRTVLNQFLTGYAVHTTPTSNPWLYIPGALVYKGGKPFKGKTVS